MLAIHRSPKIEAERVRHLRNFSIIRPVLRTNQSSLLRPSLLDRELSAVYLCMGCVDWFHLYYADTTAGATLVVVEIVQGVLNGDVPEMRPCTICDFGSKLTSRVAGANLCEGLVDANGMARELQMSWVDGRVSNVP